MTALPPRPHTNRARTAARLRACCGAALSAALLFTTPVSAETVAQDQIVTLDVLPGWTTDRGTRMAAFRLRLAPGWKTYWRAPGDAGVPPMLSLAGARNVARLALSWPVPEVFDQGGMRSIGYHDGVVVPVEITPEGAGEVRLSGVLDIGVCDEICVPARLAFDAVLPEGGARDGQIVAALVDRPETEAEAGVGDVTCALTPIDGGLEIMVRAEIPTVGPGEAAVIETGDAEVWVSEPEVTRSGDTLEARARLVHVSGGAFAVDRSSVRLTVLAGGRGVDIQGCRAN